MVGRGCGGWRRVAEGRVGMGRAVCEVYGGVGEDKGGASRVGRDFCYLGYVMEGRDRRAMGDGGKRCR